MRLLAPRVQPGDMVLLIKPACCTSLDPVKGNFLSNGGDVFAVWRKEVGLMRLSLYRLRMPRVPGFGLPGFGCLRRLKAG